MHVRCPGRPAIYKEQLGREITIAFPDQYGTWYLIPHDELVAAAGQHTPWLDSSSWQDAGGYSSANPSRSLREAIRRFSLDAG